MTPKYPPCIPSNPKKHAENAVIPASACNQLPLILLKLQVMNATSSVACDIVTLRMTHCRAEQAANLAQYHLAVAHYRTCLEEAELRQDAQAMQFFALKLADCYEHMGLREKARGFHALANGNDDFLALLSQQPATD